MKINSYLRLRPLEQKHKLKEDYFYIRNHHEEEKGERTPTKASITIHDPLKRSKDEYEFKFDKLYTSEKSNVRLLFQNFQAFLYKDVMQRCTTQALQDGTNSLILSFGHKESGKSYTLFGQNNVQLEKNLIDVQIDQSDDSRGMIIRCVHDILKKDSSAQIQLQYLDLVMDNVRDILKYVKKEQKKQSAQAQKLSFFEEQNYRQSSQNNLINEYSWAQAQNIQKDFLEMHERPGKSGATIYYLKDLTKSTIKDTQELAFFLEKGQEYSELLNRQLNYTPGLRYTQVLVLSVKGSSTPKEAQLIFVDLPEYDKLQSNVIDTQKLYEQIVINNAFNTLASILNGFNTGKYNVQNALYGNSKLTRIIQSLLQQQVPMSLQINVSFICCAWPTESKYTEVMDSLKFVEKIKSQQDTMQRKDYQGEMRTNQDKIMEEISKENVDIRYKIDSFKREHAAKLQELKNKLGLDIPIDSILKSKGNVRELQVVKEHRDAIDKTENYVKQNKDIEKKIENIISHIEDDELAKKEIQENFSQKYFIIQKKIDRLREEFKQSEMELDNTLRGQINERNEELQKVLNNTHAMLIENSELVEQLNEAVIKKTKQGDLQSKRINFMKDEGKQKAEDEYQKLFTQQVKEFDQQIEKAKETQEYLLKKKEEEIKKAADDFKNFHVKIKYLLLVQFFLCRHDQQLARAEMVKLYNMAKKQNHILTNIENGVYSQTAKKIKFNDQQKPPMPMPDQTKFQFLFQALERQANKGFSSSQAFMSQKQSNQQFDNVLSSQTGKQNIKNLNTGSLFIADQKGYQNEQQMNQSNLLSKRIDDILNPDELRTYVKELMGELNKHSESHPQILKGENVDKILEEIEKHKKAYENSSKKNNDIRIQIEAQKRLLERFQLEKIRGVPGQSQVLK